MKNKISLAGIAVVSAILGSICCVGPVMAGAVGIAAGALFAKFSDYRPFFLTFSLFALGYGFYAVYSKKQKVECEDGECKVRAPNKFSKPVLWFSTILVALIFALPYLNTAKVHSVSVANGENPKVGKIGKVVLRIDGLDCESCFVPVRKVLGKRDGVLKLVPNFERQELYVEFDSVKVKLSEIVKSIDETGFKVGKVKLIGGGAAGFAAATRANDLGARTLIVNSGLPIGGTCVNVGCVPSKLLLEMAYDFSYYKSARFGSINYNQNGWVEFKRVIAEKDEIINKLRNKNYIDVLGSFKSVDFIDGKAYLRSPHEIEANGEVYWGDKFIIATGSSPRALPFEGIDKIGYLTNREAISLEQLPKSIIIVGGGPLGLEFAQMFAMFGSQVYVIEKESRIIPLEEPEISFSLQKALEKWGIKFYTGADIEDLFQDKNLKFVKFKLGDKELTLQGEEILLAAGVLPNTSGLGLENASVELDRRGFVKVDDTLRTTAENIWAAGDCVGQMLLETVAAKEGNLAATNALEGKGSTINYDSVPHAVFTFPQVASVGATEEVLMRKLNVCACRVIPFSSVPKAFAVKRDEGLIKMVVNPHDGTVAGVHIVSHDAAEIIHEAVLAVKFKLKIWDIIDTVHVFPTFSEAIKIAALAFTRDVSVMSCCII
ncbi:MAG: mercury(II) reductase [Bacteroidota bacterium]